MDLKGSWIKIVKENSHPHWTLVKALIFPKGFCWFFLSLNTRKTDEEIYLSGWQEDN